MIRLLELRAEKDLSQRQMAKELNISQGTYNNWENGKTQPSIEQLKQLSLFFGVSVDYLIGSADEYELFVLPNEQTEEERELIQKFRNMDNETRKALLHFLKKW